MCNIQTQLNYKIKSSLKSRNLVHVKDRKYKREKIDMYDCYIINVDMSMKLLDDLS